MKEEWREAAENSRYLVSSMGRVIGVMKTILKPATDRDGYLYVGLWKTGKIKTRKVHRLVSEAFIGPMPKGYHCCHLNGNSRDNRAVNLRYVTPGENILHKIIHGTIARGEKIGSAKLTEKDVKFVIKNYKARDRKFGARALGRKFRVAQTTISNIIHGKTWNHVKRAFS